MIINLFKELTEAVAQIKENEAGVAGDVLFNGDMAAWKRFANTIRMAMSVRLSKVNAAKGKTEYAAALAAGVIGSNVISASNLNRELLTLAYDGSMGLGVTQPQGVLLNIKQNSNAHFKLWRLNRYCKTPAKAGS